MTCLFLLHFFLQVQIFIFICKTLGCFLVGDVLVGDVLVGERGGERYCVKEGVT